MRPRKSIQLANIFGIRVGVSASWFFVLFFLIYWLSSYFHEVLGGSRTTAYAVAVAGALGYFSYDGNLDSCITLRTALVKDGQVHIQAGGGVVADSDAAAEYQETVSKASALLKAVDMASRF